MKDKEQIAIDKKAEKITALLKDEKGQSTIHLGQILAKALGGLKEEKGMINYYLEQIDKHARNIAFGQRIEFFDKLWNFLHENGHNRDNPTISEHDSAWCHSFAGRYGDGKRKVVVIDNMMGSVSNFFVKEEHIIGDEDWSKYYIVRFWNEPDSFFKDCGRKSIRTLAKEGKLIIFEDDYADGERRKSWQYYEKEGYNPKTYEHDWENCILEYDCRWSTHITRSYFTMPRLCESALSRLESAYWMRVE